MDKSAMTLPEVIISIALISLVLLSLPVVFHQQSLSEQTDDKIKQTAALAAQLFADIEKVNDNDSEKIIINGTPYVYHWRVNNQRVFPISQSSEAVLEDVYLTLCLEEMEQCWEFATVRRSIRPKAALP